MKPKLVLDTNILISALKSKRGAANRLLSLIGDDKYYSYVSVPLIFEYEEVILRLFPNMPKESVDDLLNFVCKVSVQCPIYYLWRPILRDYKDDMVLEVAVAASADYIVTYNVKDFFAAKDFGIELASPRDILFAIGDINEHDQP